MSPLPHPFSFLPQFVQLSMVLRPHKISMYVIINKRHYMKCGILSFLECEQHKGDLLSANNMKDVDSKGF
jgi:hypothetical protein